MSSTCPHSMVNFGLLAAEVGLQVWGTPPYFNGLRVLAALLHSSKVVSVSQTLCRRTEGATYVRQGDHHVGHWPTFLVLGYISDIHNCILDSTVILFADDTNLFVYGKTLSEAYYKANQSLKLLSDWFTANKLSLNVDKSCYSVFGGM